MPTVYDNWERLMDAVPMEERYRQLCFAESRSPSNLSDESDLSTSSSSLHTVAYHFQNSPIISSQFEHQTEGEVCLSDEQDKTKANKAVSCISGVISLARNMLEKKFVTIRIPWKSRVQGSIEDDRSLLKQRQVSNMSPNLWTSIVQGYSEFLLKQKQVSPLFPTPWKSIVQGYSEFLLKQKQVSPLFPTPWKSIVQGSIEDAGSLLKQQRESNMSPCIFISVRELEKAIKNCPKDKVLGGGCYGTMYKGILHDQQLVAIRKSRILDYGHLGDFVYKVLILSQVNHQNLVKLLGCCLETRTPILVYEFVSNGTLYYHIHSNQQNPRFTWGDRLRIAREAAGALVYAHSTVCIPGLHRDITSSNILLDDNYTAKVSGFGDSILVPNSQREHVTEKSDVYSFGVVLAELMIGRKAVSIMETGGSLALFFLASLRENQLFRILDPRVEREGNVEQIYFVAELVKRCLCLRGEDRPTMNEVVLELESLRKLSIHPWAQEEIRNRDQQAI